jgi:exosortase
MAICSIPQQHACPKAVRWAPMAWFGALLIACYAPLLWGLARQWASIGEMSHGFFVPAVAGFVIWRKRGELAGIQALPNYWGLAIAVWGALQMILGTLAAQIFVARTAILISLVGSVLFLGGSRMLTAVAFPLGLLVFMFPVPATVHARMTLPLQLLASSAAEASLNALGVPVLRNGNLLELSHQRLSIVEACSGIHSLISLAFLVSVYGYFFDRRCWMRFLLLAAAVPIAVTANAARVTVMGLMGEYRADLAEGMAHFAEGWAFFLTALAMVIVFHRFVHRCAHFLS